MEKYPANDFKHYITYDVNRQDLILLEKRLRYYSNGFQTNHLCVFHNMNNMKKISLLVIGSRGIGVIEGFSDIKSIGLYEQITKINAIEAKDTKELIYSVYMYLSKVYNIIIYCIYDLVKEVS